MRLMAIIICSLLIGLLIDAEFAAIPCIDSSRAGQNESAEQANYKTNYCCIRGEWMRSSAAAWPARFLIGIEWTSEAVTAAATVVLAVLTFILASGTVFLWLTTRNLVDGTDDASKRELRAYVGIVKGHVRFEESAAITFTASLKIKNFGQTPAHSFTVRAGIDIANEFSSEVERKAASVPGNNTVFPKSGHTVMFSRDFGDTVKRPTGDEPTIFVFGRISYVDAFGCARWTNFRFRAVLEHGSGGRCGLATCDEGNDAN